MECNLTQLHPVGMRVQSIGPVAGGSVCCVLCVGGGVECFVYFLFCPFPFTLFQKHVSALPGVLLPNVASLAAGRA